MTINPVFTDATPVAQVPDAHRFLDDVLAGFSAPQKFMPAKYFYDAAGSDLFEAITRQLDARGVVVVDVPVVGLEIVDDRLTGVRLADGSTRAVTALVTATTVTRTKK